MIMKLRLAALLLPLSLAACGDQDFAMPWDRAPEAPAEPAAPAGPPTLAAPAVSPLEVAIEVDGTERRAVSTAERVTLENTSFVARGNEPFWTVEISGNTARYITPDNQSGRNIAVQRIVYAGGVEYVGEHAGRVFTLNIRNTPCQDSMSGERFALSAHLRSAGGSGPGCASVGAAPASAASAS
ncbi:MAG: hypothetical protein Q4F71_06675 [Paracoccus sp. (in: a-proteobacteria)]|nr:hypothetical protein [Paracoccus sp. (in: a-proteobacteria)]